MGENIPRPIQFFTEANLPKAVMQKISAEPNFVAPSSIQATTWPVALQGRDIIGIAQTGSGKTLGFIAPAIVHVLSQPRLMVSI